MSFFLLLDKPLFLLLYSKIVKLPSGSCIYSLIIQGIVAHMATEFKYIVRIMGRDLDGSRKVIQSLMDLNGVGYGISRAIVSTLGIDSGLRMGSLSDAQIQSVSELVAGFDQSGVPNWLFNRQKDSESGMSTHYVGPDLDLSLRTDLEREKFAGSWRGIRHSLGLRVRGQCTRTTG
mgnify:CR=1 FL=1